VLPVLTLNDDMRQDAVMEQCFLVANGLLQVKRA